MEPLTEEKKIERKEFFKTAALALGSLLALSWTKASAQQSPTRRKKLGMIIDLQRCILCRACTIACKQENKTPPGMLYNPVLEEETGTYPKPGRQWFPRPCYHCEKPACLESCPNKAIFKRSDGIVYIDPDLCKGVQACVGACPYEVPLFDEGAKYHDGKGVWNEIASPELGLMQKPGKRIFSGKARKCSFCLHKQDENGNYINLPACVKTCMGKAIHFGDLGDSNGKCIAHGEDLQALLKSRKNMRRKEDAGTEPNVYYLL